MNRAQIERAERVAECLEKRTHDYRVRHTEALAEAQKWKSPRSLETGAKKHTLATKQQEYTFTDEQFRIALASLEKNA